jgi:hypothetical protein
MVMTRIFSYVARCSSFGILCLASASLAIAGPPTFERTVVVALADPLTLDIAVLKGNITISYNRDGQVTIYASARDADGRNVPAAFFESALAIAQTGNRITIRSSPIPDSPGRVLSIQYKIDVPTRTEVSSAIVGAGNQTVIGIVGPARVVTGSGDITISYIGSGLVRARTEQGNISCVRVAELEAETGSGNITLLEDGPSKATVKKGSGTIDVGGAKGRFTGSTDRGDLHIKAVPWDDWLLSSTAGNIRIELPPKARFELDAATKAGEISLERVDMDKPDTVASQYHRTVNGGGKRIQVRSDSGNIFIE